MNNSEYRLMIIHSNGDGKTSQVLEYRSVDDCECAARRIEKWANGHSPWQVLRLDYDVGELRQYTESLEWYLKDRGKEERVRLNGVTRW